MARTERDPDGGGALVTDERPAPPRRGEAPVQPWLSQPAHHVWLASERDRLHVGIISLVDEATGYQEFRQRDALARILEAFIDKELQPWVQTFPSDYYSELFRLRGLDYPTGTVQRPQYFGHLTNDIVYKRIAPGVLEELKTVTEKTDSADRATSSSSA